MKKEVYVCDLCDNEYKRGVGWKLSRDTVLTDTYSDNRKDVLDICPSCAKDIKKHKFIERNIKLFKEEEADVYGLNENWEIEKKSYSTEGVSITHRPEINTVSIDIPEEWFVEPIFSTVIKQAIAEVKKCNDK